MSRPAPLAVVYADADFVAVDKPAGLLMHRSDLAAEVGEVLMQRLRDQLRRRVYLVHRLDRPTSGVVLFGLSAAAARAACAQFEARSATKTYLGVVRGWADVTGVIDHPLVEEEGRAPQAATTSYRCLATATWPLAVGRYPSARYSLVAVQPQTGRRHQIRKHFHHASHPLIGDTTHGDGRHNRVFREHLDCHRLLLHAARLRLPHPAGGELDVQAPPSGTFAAVLERLGWSAAAQGVYR